MREVIITMDIKEYRDRIDELDLQSSLFKGSAEKKKCGLLGRKLSHSYSPLIHSIYADYSYALFEVEPEDLGDFIKNGDWDAINVTVPYKREVMAYLDDISDTAKKIGAVNTVVRRPDGTLFGDNTDIFGFLYMCDRAGISLEGKKCLVLGSGGSSHTVCTALAARGAREVLVVSRSGEVNYDNVYEHRDADIIINTTPVGMYPNVGVSPIELSRFPSLSGVIDIVYNPRVTELLYQARTLGIPSVGGLSMLCAQALQASELFCGEERDRSLIEAAEERVRQECENVILVGMPGCGKSRVSEALGRLLSRQVIDTDTLVVEKRGMSIPEIFAREGEEAFRWYEHEAVCVAGAKSSMIIATGGGVPTRKNNIKPLSQNGRIVYLRRPTHELARDGRPLSENADMDALFATRRPFYEGCADIVIDVRESPEATAMAVIEALRK